MQDQRIIYMKLTNADDLLAFIIKETDTEMIITCPLLIQCDVINDRVITSTCPWVPCFELMSSEYKISKSIIISMTDVTDTTGNLKRYYIKCVNTMREMPVKQQLVDDHDKSDDIETSSEDKVITYNLKKPYTVH